MNRFFIEWFVTPISKNLLHSSHIYYPTTCLSISSYPVLKTLIARILSVTLNLQRKVRLKKKVAAGTYTKN